MNSLNIGDRVTALRKQKGWSQSDLAKAIEASRDIIGKYERNDNLPSVEVAFKLADIFEVSVDYLLGKGEQVFSIKVWAANTSTKLLKDSCTNSIPSWSILSK